jgi:ABC-2 type transport system permease protein
MLEQERWARSVATARHRRWRIATVLVLANLAVANIWLQPIDKLRLDLTEGKLYSISEPTHELLDQLREPLLIRGYFSAKTHPLLAPLIPQLRDLMKEYELAGNGKVRVEFVDPAQSPELENEANKRYAIKATPFQVADRYQAALVNSYFNILVKYGSEFETLGFADLIEVRTASNADAEVLLRNPEYDISRAIKDVLYSYQMGGKLFDSIEQPVEFIGYVSDAGLLPEQLLAYQDAITGQLEQVAARSEGKFSVRWLRPEAGDGALARQIEQEWGFKPMIASLDDEQEFYFYLTLADARQVVQLPTEDFDPAAFPALLNAGLKRFASGFTRTVALSVPQVDEQMSRYKLGGPTFGHLEQAITRDYSIRMEDLDDGSVSPEADILAVVAPHRLSETAIFAIDQFLMRGGSLVLATSPFTAELSDGELRMQDWDSGLQDWLAHHGISIASTLVLDNKSAPFPAPVARQAGDYQFRDVQMLDYPYFIDIRKRGLARSHPVTRSLPQLTMAWASPISAELRDERRVSTLLRSSPRSWLSDEMDVMPSVDAAGKSNFRSQGASRGRQTLGVLLQGRFKSFFAGRPSPLDAASADQPVAFRSVLPHSAESARLVLFSSNDFLDDQVLSAVVTGSGTQYLGPIELFLNTLDWALQDDQLLDIRSRAHFNRTLPPMERQAQVYIEYFNYGLAVLWLLLLALCHWLLKHLRRRRYTRGLSQ